jgi:hypothetical protein
MGWVAVCLTLGIFNSANGSTIPDIPGSLVLVHYDAAGDMTYNLYQSPGDVVPHGPLDVVITVTGPEIAISVDGQSVVDTVDPHPFLYGGIGVGAIWEAEARFDNVLVTGASGPLFSDTFDGAMSPDWVSINGRQQVQNGWLYSDDVGGQWRDSNIAAHTGDTAWSDYTFHLTVDPIITDHNGNGSDLWENAIVYFRVRDWQQINGSSVATGYALYLLGPSWGSPEPGTLALLTLGALVVLRRGR